MATNKPLRVRVSGNQFDIERLPGRDDDWDREYVSFSGFAGPYNPHLFAAAPDLLEALKAFVDGYEPDSAKADSPAYVLFANKADMAIKAIAKAEGRS
jgi:hypothetical protein